MLEDIRKELLKHPDKLKDVLEHFGYCNIVIRPKYIQFGRDEFSSKKSIVIKLENNRYLYIHDYARNIQKDLFSYIMSQRNVEFSVIMNEIKKILGISDYYEFFVRKGIFGGFYERVRKKRTIQHNTYPESELDSYEHVGNLRFLRDHISLQAQKHFCIGYDIESQGIVIPIRDQLGQLMGIKERFNYDVPDGEMKYFYSLPCQASQTLYGYSQNYQHLAKNTVLVFEAEKSVLQCYSYGIQNCVALGSGTISQKQVQILLELDPDKIIFMHDVGYSLENIMRNIDQVKRYSRFSEVELGYWDYFGKEYADKISPSDLGKTELQRIIDTEIKMIGVDQDEEEL